jgi:hypothetical protein
MDHIEISDEFRSELRALRDVADALPEACKSLPQLSQSNADLFRVKDDSVLAVGTGGLVITLEPTERLRELVTAVRTWKRENGVGKVA